jgi:hypothetical protein
MAAPGVALASAIRSQSIRSCGEFAVHGLETLAALAKDMDMTPAERKEVRQNLESKLAEAERLLVGHQHSLPTVREAIAFLRAPQLQAAE